MSNEDFLEALLDLKSAVEFGFAQVDARFGQVEQRFARMQDRIDTRFSETNARIDAVLMAVEASDRRLATLEARPPIR